ncbi:hypothetical protein Pyn_41146 [Prunus yedoensis var. nudiflora]|uniref:Uncharacterized protein n=1 Tax=Prunus yedoensis var. nudiflora TaxID=2094558 RepID=A0A314V095_PRUYE|nr:hypothetical protein Pyn_41146 [Prunus yedoensis var. nudiflora]
MRHLSRGLLLDYYHVLGNSQTIKVRKRGRRATSLKQKGKGGKGEMLTATGGASLTISEGTPSSFPPSGEVKRVLFLGRSTAAVSTAVTLADAVSTGAAQTLDVSRLLLRPGAGICRKKGR